jgi:membrane protease YdiL (CAAX protease family)
VTDSGSGPTPGHGAGWYPDPWRVAAWRWWDGRAWTPSTAAPSGTQPGAVAPAPLSRPVATTPMPGAAPPLEGDGPAEVVESPALRRRFGWELLIVLAIFPAPYVINALISLVESVIDPHVVQARYPNVIPGHPGASLPFIVLVTLVPLAAPALVVYLLSVSREGVRSIGLARSRWRGDLALVLPVFGIAYLVPQVGGAYILAALHVKTLNPPIGQHSGWYAGAALVSALSAGVVEEIVVLGYLVRRLEQRGWSVGAVVVVAVLVRVSYHLYYGLGVLPIVAWATVSVLLYRRYRRLLPFIIVHVLWDTTTLLAGLYGAKVIGVSALILLPTTIVFTALWWRRFQLRA